MSTVTTTRRIDLGSLPFPASHVWHGDGGTVEADVPEGDLQAAVDAASGYVDPRQRFRDAVSAALTVVDLKAALLDRRTLI